MSQIIEDDHLQTLLGEAEQHHNGEVDARSPGTRPSTAAVNYWHMAQTIRRFLNSPHTPE
ncbi:hypothetical protein ACIGB6_14450 [Paeniglutamicibacter gangotriensis]|uniref:hypothetical protein n=1 Tax=Paeniglutamicibacter gangotriensis TaxID=254787 RepID=UPI0037C8B846